jgi:hypothetical protein
MKEGAERKWDESARPGLLAGLGAFAQKITVEFDEAADFSYEPTEQKL